MTGIQSAKPSPRKLHMNAMDFAEQALALKKSGQESEAAELFQRAYFLESQAAALTVKEPARSVLHRSAASLALEFGGIREAEKLIAGALAGEPPDGMAEELRNLLETVNFRRHLRLQGVQLSAQEFQFSISGDGVDYGVAPSDAVLKRLGDVQKMLFRTAQRKRNISFEQATKPGRKAGENLTLYMEVARASSYAVTLRLGQKVDADPLFESISDFPSEVIEEFLTCVDLVNQEQYEALEDRIGEENYYQNFVGLARSIAPDGKVVSQVGFTSQKYEDEKQVSLTLTREKIKPRAEKDLPEKQVVKTNEMARVKGVLRAADTLRNRHHIKLAGDDGIVYTIIVPRQLMTDIVRPHFGNYVEIIGNWFGEKQIVLDDIVPS